VTNNIVGGVGYSAFIAPSHRCGQAQTQNQFRNNVAHSVEGMKSGEGLVFFPPKQDSTLAECNEASHFYGYKLKMTAVNSFYKSARVIFSNMVLVDNHYGIAGVVTCPGDYAESELVIRDSVFYGDSISPDCPPDGGFCHRTDKTAIVVSGPIQATKKPHQSSPTQLPFWMILKDGCWTGRNSYENNKFINYSGTTQTGTSSHVFRLNPESSDYISPVRATKNEFIDVGRDALAFLQDPPTSWANLEDCVDFPCSMPKNVIFQMKESVFISQEHTPFLSGVQHFYDEDQRLQAPNFQLIADNPAFAPYVPNCARNEASNLYVCETQDLGLLVFESLDADSFDRGMQPVYVQMQGTNLTDGVGMNNELNSFRDNVWDGFYTGQKRASRFPSIVYAPQGSVYNITFTGSPAKKMRFELRTDDSTAGMTVRIAYPSAMSRKVTKNGVLVDMNPWSEAERGYSSIQQTHCGENRYIGVKNILEFYITAGCRLDISPRNAVQTMVRMEFKMQDFFDNGGTTLFIDRLASTLGIHASTIKIVSVYEGSLVVNYGIENDDEEELE